MHASFLDEPLRKERLLLLCQNLLPPEGRRLEISKGPDRKPYFATKRLDYPIGVSPWPFDVDTFTVGVEAFQLKQLQFKSDQKRYEVIQQANILRHEWTVTKS